MASRARIAVLELAVREELAMLWDDLEIAHSRRRVWSIHCMDLAERIQHLTKLVGPTAWGEVPWTLLADGIYQRVLAEIGIEAGVPLEKVRAMVGPEIYDWRAHG